MLVYYVSSCYFSLVVIVHTKRRKILFSKFIRIRDSRLEKYGGTKYKNGAREENVAESDHKK